MRKVILPLRSGWLLPALAMLVFSRFASGQDRFVVSDGVIADTITGLQWRVGPDSDTDWFAAQDWVNSLGGSWRMPTMDELQALYEAGITGGNWGPFENTQDYVWSKDTDGSSAWVFLFYCDPELRMLFDRTHHYGIAFAVCSDQAVGVVVPEVIVQNGLQWRVGPDRDMTFDEACDWVISLSDGSEWRMPTRAELEALFLSGINTSNWGPFQTSGDNVWSGEVRGSTTAWYFYFSPIGYESFQDRELSEGFRTFAVHY